MDFFARLNDESTMELSMPPPQDNTEAEDCTDQYARAEPIFVSPPVEPPTEPSPPAPVVTAPVQEPGALPEPINVESQQPVPLALPAQFYVAPEAAPRLASMLQEMGFEQLNTKLELRDKQQVDMVRFKLPTEKDPQALVLCSVCLLLLNFDFF